MSHETWSRSFTGAALREIAFPLGGIGTGTVSLGGRGNLRDWEIFNRPSKGCNLPYTFFCCWVGGHGDRGAARVLERRLLPPYTGAAGVPTGGAPGLPRLREAVFTGQYPIARIQFHDASFPVQVSLEAFNPLIPMDEESSGLPIALFNWTLTNTSNAPLEATVAFCLLNTVGADGLELPGGRHHPQFGRNLNSWREADGARGLFMTGSRLPEDHAAWGNVALATGWPDVTYRLRWERAGWWDDAQNFWDGFTQNRGVLPDEPAEEISPDGQTDVGVLGLRATVGPGAAVTLPFLLAWHFPNLTNNWNHEAAVKGKRLGNWYTTKHSDAWEAACDTLRRLPDLERGTRRYCAALYGSTLPVDALDAAGANASILRTTTLLRTEDGRMNAFEGCSDKIGCCPMNCTHVWNYAMSAAYLFPVLERSVRKTDFQHNTRASGDMAFRTLLPLVGELWAMKPAADGQMGTVMKAYREWRQCGDRAFLEELWPGIERALEFAWKPGSWDADRDGVMEGEQHNTYDIEFFGPNSMMGSLYLGALKAAGEMAVALGLEDKARAYAEMAERGALKMRELLWNGEYYVQRVQLPEGENWKPQPSYAQAIRDGETEPRYQYGSGCLADQLLGQWFASVVGLGRLLPQKEVQSALQAITRHNWKADLSEHESVQRVYALNNEAGLLLCTWPNGGRPRYPFPYADEVWTGIEYQVAAHCILEGLVEEGLAIVRGVRDRHDGEKRNPWDEFECGHHYARALSSWSLILALSGYRYDACAGLLGFEPVVNRDNFRCLFTAGTGWGVFAQRRDDGGYSASIELLGGNLKLKRLALPVKGSAAAAAKLDGELIAAAVEGEEVVFEEPVSMVDGVVLQLACGPSLDEAKR